MFFASKVLQDRIPLVDPSPCSTTFENKSRTDISNADIYHTRRVQFNQVEMIISKIEIHIKEAK